jgi:membrane protein DedA with SNARE-associated domain
LSIHTEQSSVIEVILLLAFFAQALKEIGIPSPGLTQGLLLYAGYQFSYGEIHIGMGIVLFSFLGSLSGAYLIYCLFRFGGHKLLARINHHVFISPKAMEKARNKVATNSLMTVLVGRSIPGLMVPTSIVAGTIKMPIGKFLMGIVLPLSLWMAILTTIGSSYGHFTPQIILSPNRFLLLLGALITFSVLTGIVILWKKNPSKVKKEAAWDTLREDVH